MAKAEAAPPDGANEFGLPDWDDAQSPDQLDRAYISALKEFNARTERGEFRSLSKGTIVLVNGNGAVTIGQPGESLVAVSQRHYETHKGSFDGLFEFRIE